MTRNHSIGFRRLQSVVTLLDRKTRSSDSLKRRGNAEPAAPATEFRIVQSKRSHGLQNGQNKLIRRIFMEWAQA